jgi:hypothetical protein
MDLGWTMKRVLLTKKLNNLSQTKSAARIQQLGRSICSWGFNNDGRPKRRILPFFLRVDQKGGRHIKSGNKNQIERFNLAADGFDQNLFVVIDGIFWKNTGNHYGRVVPAGYNQAVSVDRLPGSDRLIADPFQG